MDGSSFALALDAGTTRVTAATARFEEGHGVQVAPFALGADRLDTAAVAFVTDDGEVLFGDEAETRGADRPERLIREFTRDVGDRAPLVVGGFAVGAAELLARLVRWSIGVVTDAVGSRPGAIAVTHPTGWRAHRLASLRTALRDQGLDDVLLVPSAVVAAERASDAVRGRLIGVYDLGGGTFEASILRGTELLGPPVAIDAGGSDLDHALMDHVLASVGADAHPLRAGRGTAAAAHARREVAAARERLSTRADATMAMALEDRELQVRLTRYELDSLAASTVERTVDALDLALAGAQVEASELDEIVLVGGAARTPLVAQKVSERFDRPINAPDDPQLTAVLGAADAAWTRLQKLQPVHEALSEPVPEDQPDGPGAFTRPLPAGRRRRAPYGAAAALAAGAVLVAAGVVFGSATPLGDPTGAGQDISSDADGDRAGGAHSTRAAAGYSTGTVDSAGAPESGAGAASSGDRDRGSLDRGERAPRTPQPVDSATAAPSRGSGSTTAPASGAAGGAAAPSTGSSTPTPTEDPVIPATGDAQPDPTPELTPDPVPDPAPDPTPDPVPEPEPTPSDPPVETPPAGTPPPTEETAPPSSADAPPGTAAP